MIHTQSLSPCFPSQVLWRLKLQAIEQSGGIIVLYDHLQQTGMPPNAKFGETVISKSLKMRINSSFKKKKKKGTFFGSNYKGLFSYEAAHARKMHHQDQLFREFFRHCMKNKNHQALNPT